MLLVVEVTKQFPGPGLAGSRLTKTLVVDRDVKHSIQQQPGPEETYELCSALLQKFRPAHKPKTHHLAPNTDVFFTSYCKV